MCEMIENEAADIYTTEQVAAVLMCATKSNYSWDLEIKVYDGKIFIDKRSEEDDKQSKTSILNYQTVCVTSLEHQPETNITINGIRPLMKEAQKINNSWLHHAGS